MKRSHGVLIGCAILLLGGFVVFLTTVVAGWLYLPTFVRERVVAEAETQGIALEPGEISFGWQWLELSGATVKLINAPSFEANVGELLLEFAAWKPAEIELDDVQVRVRGSLPRALFELGAWTQSYPSTYALPIVAKGVTVTLADPTAAEPWLGLSGGTLVRRAGGAAFSADSAKLGGFELGKVSAGFTKTASTVSIGFGDQSAQAAPLRLDATTDAGGGRVSVTLAPTRLGFLSLSLGIPLPLPSVIASGNVDLVFPPGLVGGAVQGKLSARLNGFVPPHPPELDGFVFGDLTTLETDLHVDESRNRVTLTNTQVKAGRFELNGGGSIERDGDVAIVDIALKGALPCDALAGAAAESRLAVLLGRASAKQGKHAASVLVGGEVSVDVSIKARSDDLLRAEVTRTIGVGCGLKPLTLEELLKLTPSVQDLAAIGGEVGKKLESIGKELGLPEVPSGFPLPKLPKIDIEIKGKDGE